jgi:hypothetical protein
MLFFRFSWLGLVVLGLLGLIGISKLRMRQDVG